MASKSAQIENGGEDSLLTSAVTPVSYCAFQVGRLQLHWKGEHRLEQTSEESAQNNLNSLKYYLVKTVETDEDFKEKAFFSCVPTTWVSVCMKFMLYPPVGTHSANGRHQEPNQWRSNVFKRFRYPTKDWFEYDIVQIFNLVKPGSHDRIFKAATAASKGMKNFEDLLKSDNDESLGRGNRVKRKKVLEDAEMEQPKKRKVKKSTEEKELMAVPATTLAKADNDKDLQSSSSELDNYNVIANVVLPHLADNWNSHDDYNSNQGDLSAPIEQTWLEQPDETMEQVGTPIPDKTIMDLDTLELCPSTSSSNSGGPPSEPSWMLQHVLHQALERLTCVENGISAIEAKMSTNFLLIVEKLEALDQKIEKMRKVAIHKMAETDFDHHTSVVETYLKELPVTTTKAVEAIDVLLQDNTLAVSLVFVFVEKLKTVKTVNKFFYQMLGFLVAKDVSNSLQWKMSPRGKDNRPGMAGLFNLLAVFGVAARIFAQKKGEKLNEGRIQQLVRDARKTHAREYRATSRDNKQDEVVIDAPTGPNIEDNDGITLKQHIDRLQILVNNFTL